MTKYRAIVSDLDRCFKLDNRMGYKFLTAHTLFILGVLAYSVVLEMGL